MNKILKFSNFVKEAEDIHLPTLGAAADAMSDRQEELDQLKSRLEDGDGYEEEQDAPDNYMFFGNLKTIKRLVDILLEMDPDKVSSVLSNGHDWAEDHIATSKDDIEEVANFLIGEMEEHGGEDKDLMSYDEYDETY